MMFSFAHLFFENSLEAERSISITGTLEELVLEFDPVETQSMEGALEHIHVQKNEVGEGHEWEPEDPCGESKSDNTGISLNNRGTRINCIIASW